jgi:hypothetical protein
VILVIIVLKQLTWNRTWLCLPNSGMISGRNSCLFCEFPSFTDLSWPDQNDSNLTNLLQSTLNANSRIHDMCRLTCINVGLYPLGFGTASSLITVLDLLGFGTAISLIPGLYLLEFATASSLIAGLFYYRGKCTMNEKIIDD